MSDHNLGPLNFVQRPIRGDISPSASRYFDGDDWGWQDLWLTESQVVAACRERFGVRALSATLLPEGMLNQTWRIRSADHDRVLRVGRVERTAEQVAYEQLTARVWREVVPELVTAEHHDVPVIDGHVLTLFPFIEGISGTTVSGAVRARQLASAMAAMHRASLILDLPQRPGFGSVDDGFGSVNAGPSRSSGK